MELPLEGRKLDHTQMKTLEKGTMITTNQGNAMMKIQQAS